jgi:predicted dehydrogenase
MSVRFTQVGIGVRGTHWAKVIRDEPRAEVVAYVDLRVDKARKKAREWGQETVPCFANLSEALKSVDSDAVLLVTPPEGHREQASVAFEHDRHVLCEKPLAEELGEAIEIVRQAERHGRQLMVGMNFRYLPASQALRQIVREARFGKPGYGHFVYLRNRDGRRSDLNDYPLTMEQPMLLEQSIHHLDLMRYCYDVEVEAVAAHTWRPSWSTYADDCCVSVLLRFESGLHVNYIGTWTAGWNEFQFEWRTDFPDGVVIQKSQFDDLYAAALEPGLALEGPLFKTTAEAEPLNAISVGKVEDFIDDTRGLLGEFIDAVAGDKRLVTSGQDHIRTLGLVFACIAASRSEQWITLRDFYASHGIPEAWL